MDMEEAISRLKTSRELAAQEAKLFHDEVVSRYWWEAAEDCQSPIEQLFLLAWVTLIESARREGSMRFAYVGPRDDFAARWSGIEGNLRSRSDIIGTQVPIGRYRADFVIRRADNSDLAGRIMSPPVVVECDGHEFHERTKDQAARDKKRDRILQEEGFHVLRFTGSEIWKDAGGCARQVDAFVKKHLERAEMEGFHVDTSGTPVACK